MHRESAIASPGSASVHEPQEVERLRCPFSPLRSVPVGELTELQIPNERVHVKGNYVLLADEAAEMFERGRKLVEGVAGTGQEPAPWSSILRQ